MNSLKIINTPVSVTAVGFDRFCRPYPRRMEWDGLTYYLTNSGPRVRRGEYDSCTLTVSDGRHTFCLRERAGNWTLVSVF